MRKPVDTLAFREAREAKRLLHIQHPNPERNPDHKRRKERKIEKESSSKHIMQKEFVQPPAMVNYPILSYPGPTDMNPIIQKRKRQMHRIKLYSTIG